MARRLPSLTCMLTLFCVLALAMPVQVMMIYDHGPTELLAIWHKLTWLNQVVMIGLLANAVLLYQVSPYLTYTIPGLIMAMIVNNYIVGYYSTDFSPYATAFATIGFLALNLPMLDTRVLWVLKHPDRRWWRRSERKQLSVPLQIEGARLNPIRTESFDLSETGMFIAGPQGLGVGDWVNVKLAFDSLSQVRARARVVRKAEAKGIYPAGVGVEFVDLTYAQRRMLKRSIDRMADV